MIAKNISPAYSIHEKTNTFTSLTAAIYKNQMLLELQCTHIMIERIIHVTIPFTIYKILIKINYKNKIFIEN